MISDCPATSLCPNLSVYIRRTRERRFKVGKYECTIRKLLMLQKIGASAVSLVSKRQVRAGKRNEIARGNFASLNASLVKIHISLMCRSHHLAGAAPLQTQRPYAELDGRKSADYANCGYLDLCGHPSSPPLKLHLGCARMECRKPAIVHTFRQLSCTGGLITLLRTYGERI